MLANQIDAARRTIQLAGRTKPFQKFRPQCFAGPHKVSGEYYRTDCCFEISPSGGGCLRFRYWEPGAHFFDTTRSTATEMLVTSRMMPASPLKLNRTRPV